MQAQTELWPTRETRTKRIAVVTIGGTVFMTGAPLKPGEVKLPNLRSFSKQSSLSDGFSPERVQIAHHHLFNIDSARIRTGRLNKLGRKLAQLSNDKRIDAIVVLSGTDKMHRIVTRLAHHLHDLGKPVVFTGAQIELTKQGSDAKRNYEHAIRTAWFLSHAKYNQVVLSFGRNTVDEGAEVHHALNVLKFKPDELDAFDHPNKRVIARVKYDQEVKLTRQGKKLFGPKLLKDLLRNGHGSIKPPRPDRRKKPRATFDTIKEDLIDMIDASETKSLKKIRVRNDSEVIILHASGKGNVNQPILQKIAKRAGNRPVIVTTEAGADVNLAAYEPGRDALAHGMLPSGGLIPISAQIRAEYLAHHMAAIKQYASQNCPRESDRNDFERKLFAGLYLSGAQFRGKITQKKHEEALGITIPKHDLLINRSIQSAIRLAHNEIFKKPPTQTSSKPKRYEMSPQNRTRTDRLTIQTERSLPPFKKR